MPLYRTVAPSAGTLASPPLLGSFTWASANKSGMPVASFGRLLPLLLLVCVPRLVVQSLLLAPMRSGIRLLEGACGYLGLFALFTPQSAEKLPPPFVEMLAIAASAILIAADESQVRTLAQATFATGVLTTFQVHPSAEMRAHYVALGVVSAIALLTSTGSRAAKAALARATERIVGRYIGEATFEPWLCALVLSIAGRPLAAARYPSLLALVAPAQTAASATSDTTTASRTRSHSTAETRRSNAFNLGPAVQETS